MHLSLISTSSKNKITSKWAEGQTRKNKFTQKFILLRYFHSPLVIYSVFLQWKNARMLKLQYFLWLSLNNKFLRGIILQYLKLLVSFAAINPTNIFRFWQFAINIKYKKNIDFPIFLIDILHVSKPFCFSSNIFCYKFPRKNYFLSCQFSYVLAIKISFKMSLFFSVF